MACVLAIHATCVVVSLCVVAAYRPGNTECSQPLGMQSGTIPDEHVSATSFYDTAVHPFYARARTERGGGAWCPRNMVQDQGTEHLEINLVKNFVITKVEVQGRFGNGQGKEFAQQYKLQYYREAIGRWVLYRDGYGSQLLEGNTNTYLPRASPLRPPIVASKVRFIPYSDTLRTVCMRVELYGCLHRGGLLSYTTEDGHKIGVDDGLLDLTYDGHRSDGLLTGGLGQLTDGEVGHNNFRVDVRGRRNGYEWVGWSSSARGQDPVEILFYFDSVRNFSSVWIYVNNFLSKDVQAFSRANVLLSLDGGHHFSKGVVYDGKHQTVFEEATNISIPLHNSNANAVKLELFFALKWMMISEVFFDSTPCKCDISILTQPSTTLPDEAMYADQTPVAISKETQSSSTALIVAVTILGIVCCILPIVLGFLGYRAYIAGREMPSNDFLAKNFQVNMNDANVNVSKQQNGNSFVKEKFYGDLALEEEVATTYQQPNSKIRSEKLPYFKPGFGNAFEVPLESDDSADYAIPNTTLTPPPPFSEAYSVPPPIPLSKPPSLLSVSRKGNPIPSVRSVQTPDQEYYSAPRLCKETNIRSVTGTVLYFNETVYTKREKSIPNIPPGMYDIIETVGEGDFGTIQLCKIKDSVTTTFKNITPGAVCVIKKLKPKASDIVIQKFKEEATILSKLDNPNIVRLLGSTNTYDGQKMLVEYSEKGDLHHFLREHTLAGTTHLTRHKPVLSISDVIYIATQIASAMAYFEFHHFIHRDLAARNCVVYDKLFIKITDVAMSRPVFRTHYYSPDGMILLPVRWMSWEAALEGRFTSKLDVWAFGVTLWELFTLCSCLPFDSLSDLGFLENLSHCYYGGGSGMALLEQPSSCSRDLYQIMKSCWSTKEEDRPTFYDLHSYLQKKNVGPVR